MTFANRAGMTMIEVLCATALASVLMVAVLGVVGGLARHEKTLARHEPRPEWNVAVERLLEDDLRRCRSLEPTSDGFRLTGPLARDAATGAATWRDLEVTYTIARLRNSHLLVRSTRNPRSISDLGAAEVVCADVARLVLAPPGDVFDATRIQRNANIRLPVGPPPAIVRVLLLTKSNESILDATLQL